MISEAGSGFLRAIETSNSASAKAHAGGAEGDERGEEFGDFVGALKGLVVIEVEDLVGVECGVDFVGVELAEKVKGRPKSTSEME